MDLTETSESECLKYRPVTRTVKSTLAAMRDLCAPQVSHGWSGLLGMVADLDRVAPDWQPLWKEFGELRVYGDVPGGQVDAVVAYVPEAERQARVNCQECGAPGT